MKEHGYKHDHIQSADVRKEPKTKRTERTHEIVNSEGGENEYNMQQDKHETSDSDSGVDDEELLDVVLTEDQQRMIVAVLFDEDMNLRKEFDRDENGRIVVSNIHVAYPTVKLRSYLKTR